MANQFRDIQRPESGEFPPYASMYIDLISDEGQLLQHMADNIGIVKKAVHALPADKLDVPHIEGEWTVKEILVHIIDDERIYGYRALRFARGDTTDIPGFDPDDYASTSNANTRPLSNIFEEYETVRQATITLLNNLDDDALIRSGTANDNPVTVRALAYHMAGHELHHLYSIQENYG
jgi:uncharacterized damage-inducible protein DinB